MNGGKMKMEREGMQNYKARKRKNEKLSSGSQLVIYGSLVSIHD